MFTLLDLINQYLGYFNMNTKIKNRVYNIAGTLGVIYLFYVAYRFLMNQYFLRGSLILALALLLAYFLYLNFYYFFSSKQAPFDVSPHLARVLRIKPKEESTGEQINQHGNQAVVQNAGPGDLNGHFSPHHVLPAQILISDNELANIKEIVADMISQHILTTNYQGASEQQIKRRLHQNGDKPIFAIGAGALIPYFTIKRENNNYVVYAGINASRQFRVGTLTYVGLQSVDELTEQRIKLYPASLVLRGGDYKSLGRNAVMTGHNDYVVRARVAFQK